MTARPHPVLLVFVLVLGVILIAPTVIIAVMSFSAEVLLRFPPKSFSLRWYEAFLGNETWTRSMATSVEVAIATSLIAGLLGTLMALGIDRGRYPWKQAVNALVLGPLLVPPVILAIGLFFMYVRWHVTGTILGLVAADTALGLPYVVLVVGGGLRMFNRTLELAAHSLGAGPVRTFMLVTLPSILPSVVAGILFAFITSWDEVIIAYFLTTPEVRTLPVVMWGASTDTTDPTLAAVATFLSTTTTTLLVLFLFLQSRRVKA